MGRLSLSFLNGCPSLSVKNRFSPLRKTLGSSSVAQISELPRRFACPTQSSDSAVMLRSMAIFVLGVVLVAVTGSSLIDAQIPLGTGLETIPLFRIERSKNANFVQYDVQVGPDGKLDPNEPVIAYWIRRAEDGRRQELTAFQRAWYYGFKATYDPQTNSALLEMTAKNLRPIRVREVEGTYRGETIIAGQPAFLDRIFVTSVPSGMTRKVTSVELFGKDAATGADRYERLTP